LFPAAGPFDAPVLNQRGPLAFLSLVGFANSLGCWSYAIHILVIKLQKTIIVRSKAVTV
jgi:hypothetical protein